MVLVSVIRTFYELRSWKVEDPGARSLGSKYSINSDDAMILGHHVWYGIAKHAFLVSPEAWFSQITE